MFFSFTLHGKRNSVTISTVFKRANGRYWWPYWVMVSLWTKLAFEEQYFNSTTVKSGIKHQWFCSSVSIYIWPAQRLQTNGLNSSAVYSRDRLRENYKRSSIVHFCTSQVRLQTFRTDYCGAYLFVLDSDHAVLPGMQSTARLWFGPDPDLLKPSGRLCPPQHGSYWTTWHIIFSILSSGDTESFGCHFPTIQEQDYWCSFHAYLADSFLLSSICCLTTFPLLHVSNQQLTHGGLLPVWGSKHSISCQPSIPHGWLPLTLFVAASRTFMPV